MYIIYMYVYTACMPGHATLIIGMQLVDSTRRHPSDIYRYMVTRPTPTFKCRCPLRSASCKPPQLKKAAAYTMTQASIGVSIH